MPAAPAMSIYDGDPLNDFPAAADGANQALSAIREYAFPSPF